MKKMLVLTIISLLWATGAFAAGMQYKIRVDGLACPYCAYGIEKKLNKLEGVKFLDMDLEKGVVTVNTFEGVTLSEKQMTQLFKDAGFTYRSMESRSMESTPQ